MRFAEEEESDDESERDRGGKGRGRGKAGRGRGGKGQGRSKKGRPKKGTDGELHADVKCFNCNRYGHYADQCPEPKRRRDGDGGGGGGKGKQTEPKGGLSKAVGRRFNAMQKTMKAMGEVIATSLNDSSPPTPAISAAESSKTKRQDAVNRLQALLQKEQ